MIRLKGNAGTGNVMNAVRHARAVFSEIRKLETMREDEIFAYATDASRTRGAPTRAAVTPPSPRSSSLYRYAKELRVPVELVEQVRANGRLPVVTFAAGGLATPADVAMLMELGVDGVFVGSGIFKSDNPEGRAKVPSPGVGVGGAVGVAVGVRLALTLTLTLTPTLTLSLRQGHRRGGR